MSQVISGDAPAFAATDTATTATAGVTTKVVFDTTLFDTASAFDGSKFQPLVAGYYQVNLAIFMGVNTSLGNITANIYKNGAAYVYAVSVNSAGFSVTASISAVIYLNGSTDYLEAYGRNGANANLGVASFSASLVRGA